MIDPCVEERLEIIRRILDRGKQFALENDHMFVDLFQHVDDELTWLKDALEDCNSDYS